jgi:hypothetical protein
MHTDTEAGLVDFIATRSGSLLRAAWLLTGDAHYTTYLTWRRRWRC